MSTPFDRLRARIAEFETEIEADLARQRKEFGYRIEKGRVTFDAGVSARHRAAREGLRSFLSHSRIMLILTAPVIYALIVPFVLLDLCVVIYQAVCFPVYGIARVPRRDYIVIDRQALAYLNGLQKLNCVYCGYCNGLIGWVREVAGRTEAYWCPIKHAARMHDPHAHYGVFLDYGNEIAFRAHLDQQRHDGGF